MQYATFGDMRLGLNDLFDNKIGLVEATLSFQIYQDQLTTSRDTFESLYKAAAGIPLAEELADTDFTHDTSGRAFYYVNKAVQAMRDADSTVKKTLSEITHVVVPTLSTLTDSYEDEAARIADKRKVLSANDAFLENFSIGPTHTLKSLLTTHVEAGEKLDEQLSRRAGEVADDKTARKKTSLALRGKTIGLLSRFRQALADEVAANTALPRDLESQVFAYFDQLEENRAARKNNPDTTDPSPEAPDNQ